MSKNGDAPDADLVDVRIGTAFGAGPFEIYIIDTRGFFKSSKDALNLIILIVGWKNDTCDDANFFVLSCVH